MFVITKGKPKTVNLLKDKKNSCAGMPTFGNVTRREKDGSLTNKGKKQFRIWYPEQIYGDIVTGRDSQVRTK